LFQDSFFLKTIYFNYGSFYKKVKNNYVMTTRNTCVWWWWNTHNFNFTCEICIGLLLETRLWAVIVILEPVNFSPLAPYNATVERRVVICFIFSVLLAQSVDIPWNWLETEYSLWLGDGLITHTELLPYSLLPGSFIPYGVCRRTSVRGKQSAIRPA